MNDAERIRQIDDLLRGLYPETTALRFTSPFTLLVAAVLAAQCTDERVNQVTETLFGRFPAAAAFGDAPLEKIEEAVQSTGFYKQKAKTLKALGAELAARHGGRVPETLAELTALPGIGRKTANLVLGNSLGIPGVFVDTHVTRLAQRIGFTRQTNPDKIEADLDALLAPERKVAFSNLLTYHGREICRARKAECPRCPVAALCPKIGI